MLGCLGALGLVVIITVAFGPLGLIACLCVILILRSLTQYADR